jgi:hypothetical protein
MLITLNVTGALDELERAPEPPPDKPNKIKAPTGLPVELEKAWNDEFAEQFKKYLQGMIIIHIIL